MANIKICDECKKRIFENEKFYIIEKKGVILQNNYVNIISREEYCNDCFKKLENKDICLSENKN